MDVNLEYFQFLIIKSKAGMKYHRQTFVLYKFYFLYILRHRIAISFVKLMFRNSMETQTFTEFFYEVKKEKALPLLPSLPVGLKHP